ncbi:shikimate kinase [Pseudoflavonifractor phocaeensis]|uniref:shikimate kinase n=1 Tax=Pseudoflavonifractor phocaeensis TaxID=1870988 RepID=UPI001F3B7DC0|nr:shikimate kinase [Pseudoflavonifractor phocaeensis]MCF2661323.1 AAA family ATPase [Pseudoflavonifractor phocaeensis]
MAGKRFYGLIGEKLGHSFSPAIHGKLADYEYRLIELTPEELGPFLQMGQFQGLNVTIPYKKAVIPYCAELTPQARHIGSVNTILRRPDGTLLGHNTDYYGFAYLLRSAGAEVAKKKALVLGTGGASLTVHAVLRDLGTRERVTISRTGPDNYGNLERHADAQIIVNTTPVGMYPNTGKAPLDLSRFPKLEGAFDLIYNPAKTQFLLDAEKLGVRNANGLGMLVAQAKAAAEMFLDRPIPDERVDEIIREMERNTRNLMLIGMPGCGKTTVGQALAQRLGRKLVDTDVLIEEEAGRTIPEIFAQDGEEAFRRLEHEILCRVSRESGLVIATGGGVVTRPENLDPLRQNSTVIFLRRPLDQLPVDGRPVSQANNLETLYQRRLPLYQQASDWAVDNIVLDDTITEIMRRFSK